MPLRPCFPLPCFTSVARAIVPVMPSLPGIAPLTMEAYWVSMRSSTSNEGNTLFRSSSLILPRSTLSSLSIPVRLSSVSDSGANLHPSALVMNIATHNHVYSLYPAATFTKNRCIRTSSTRKPSPATMGKWKERGWRIAAKPRAALDAMLCPWRQRHVGDDLCWSVPLPCPIYGPSVLPVVEQHRWECLRHFNKCYAMSFRTRFSTSTRQSALVAAPCTEREIEHINASNSLFLHDLE